MFAPVATFNPVSRLKQAPSLINWLLFNTKQSPHYDVGFFGEKVACALFQDAGFKAYKPKSCHGVDLHCIDRNTGEIFKVEVKTARMSERLKSWQFCLNKPKNCVSSNADYILLICVAQNGIFTYLIPSALFGKTKSFTIASHPLVYRGKVSAFRNRGDLSFQASQEIYQIGLLQ